MKAPLFTYIIHKIYNLFWEKFTIHYA